MKKVVGLDVGTNSIGWALLEIEENVETKALEKALLIDGGVYAIPWGDDVDIESSNKHPNRVRREARSKRRLIRRRKQRKRDLKRYLEHTGWIKPEEWDSVFKSTNLYELRYRGLRERLTLQELARIFYYFAAHRGFKSSKKTLSEDSKKEFGKDREWLQKFKDIFKQEGIKTFGEYLWKRYQNHLNVRRLSQTDGLKPVRQLIEEEFDLIWNIQKRYHPDYLTDEAYRKIRDIIFRQQPLKGPISLISRCMYNPSRQVARITHPLYEKFRVLKLLNDLRIKGKKLSDNQFKTAYELLIREKDYKPKKLAKKLGLSNHEDLSHSEDIKNGSAPFHQLVYNALGKKLFDSLSDDQWNTLWYYWYSYDDPFKLKEKLQEVITQWFPSEKVQEDSIEKLAFSVLDDKPGSYSLTVLKKMIPYLERRFYEREAIVLAGIDNAISDEKFKPLYEHPEFLKEAIYIIKEIDEKHLLDNIEQWLDSKGIPYKQGRLYNPAKGIVFHPYFSRFKSDNPAQYIDRSTNNPVTKQLLHAVNNLIISLQEKHGNIDEVRIEFARSFKMGEKDKLKYKRSIEQRRDEREKAKRELLNNNIIPTNDMVTRYLLWKEQREECPYTGKKISFEQAFSSATEIDHIYPYSASMDNSFVNKVLVFTEANQQKGKRTPFEWKGNDPDEWKKFKEIVSKIYSEGPIKNIEKYKRLTAHKTTEDVSLEWQNRQLTDTAYIAKLARRVLEELHGFKVEPVRASATAIIRRHLGLNSVLAPKVRIPKEIVEKFINLFPDSTQFWTVIKNSDKSIIAFSGSKSETIPKDNKWYKPTNAEESDGVKLDEILKDLEPFTFDVISGNINSREDGEFFINPEKERSDHLHHFVDAVAIALYTPAIRQAIHSEMEERLYKKLDPIKKDIIRQLQKFSEQIIVVHRRKRKLPLSPTKRRVRTGRKNSRVITVKGQAIRGQLHKDTFYGKIIPPSYFPDPSKPFVYSITIEDPKKLKKNICPSIVYPKAREILCQQKSIELDGGRIRHVRRMVYQKPAKKYKSPYYNEKAYVETKNNWFAELIKDENGNLQFNIVSLWDAAERQKQSKLFKPNAFMYIYRNDMFLLFFPEPELESSEEYKDYIAKMQDILNREQVIDRSKYPDIYRFVSRHAFRLQKMSTTASGGPFLVFRHHREATLNMPPNMFPYAACIQSEKAYKNCLPYRVTIDRMGQIIKLEEAF